MYSLIIAGPNIYRNAIADQLRHFRGDIRIAAQTNHLVDARRLVAAAMPDALLLISAISAAEMKTELTELRRIDLDVNIFWWALHGEASELQTEIGDTAEVISWQSDANSILQKVGGPNLIISSASPTPKLTTQEHLILQLAAEGLSNRAIAFRLGISESTVKNHLRHIGAKFNTSSRAQAVWQAVQWGYLRNSATEMVNFGVNAS